MLPRGWDRRTIVLLAVALLFVIALNLAQAQVFDMEKDRVPMTVLDGPVRFHTGDDADGKLGWASPGFEDSSWALIGSGKSWSEQGYKDYGGLAWYRFRVVLPHKHRQLALYIPSLFTSYQVFAGGRLIGQMGGLPPHESVHTTPPCVFRLPAETTDSVLIAIRVWHWPRWVMYTPGGFSRPPRIGDADLIADWQSREVKNRFWSLSATGYAALLYVLAGIAGIVLYLLRRKEREYLFFGAYELFSGAAGLAWLYRNFYDTPVNSYDVFQYRLTDAALLCFVAFLPLVLRSHRSKWYWVPVASVVCSSLMTIPMDAGWISVSLANGLGAGLMVPYYLTILVLLIQSARRRDPDALLLLIPVGLDYGVNAGYSITFAAATSGSAAAQGFLGWWDRIAEWPFPMGMTDIADTLMQLSIFGILLLRFARSRRDEERLKNELEAARAVQQVLVPEEIPTVPGFAIEAVYHPAGEVGGDFYQIVPTASGAVLIVIGDVSGKGMPAAMMVPLLVGTVRTLAHFKESPAEILTAMNQRMLARSKDGFTTCLVLRIDSDGAATVANAGHLAPYLGAQELRVEGGLPLGLTAESIYSEASFRLEADQELTLLTDGVAEARAKNGVLFGFERTASISTLSAEHIAATAKAFGQQDDITVLKIRRCPVPELDGIPLAASPSTSAA
jgi:hypothetical protein